MRYDISRFLNIKPDEMGKAFLFTIFFILVITYGTIIQYIPQAIFNVRFGVEYLPYMYFIIGAVTFVLHIILSYVFLRFNNRYVFPIIMASTFLMHMGSYFIIAASDTFKILLAFVFIINQVAAASLSLIRWLIIQKAVNIDSLKRLFPIAGAGGTIGIIMGGFLLRITYNRLKPELLYLLSGVLIILISLIATFIQKKYRTPKTLYPRQQKVGSRIRDVSAFLKNNKFYLYLIIVGVIINILFYCNDYLFNEGAKRLYPDEAQLSAFFGTFMFFESLISVFFEIFIISRLINKIGSLRMIYFIIISALIGIAVLLIGGIPFSLVISKTIFIIFVIVVSDSIFQLFYQPIAEDKKDFSIAFFQSTIEFAGMITGGGVALLYSSGLVSKEVLLVINIGLLSIVLVIWWMKNTGFLHVITNALNFDEHLEINKIIGKMGIKNFLPVILDKIESAKASSLSIALDIIRMMDFNRKQEFINRIFQKNHTETQLKVLTMIRNDLLPVSYLADLIPYVNNDSSVMYLTTVFLHYARLKDDAEFTSRFQHFTPAFLDTATGEQDNYPALMYRYLMNKDSDTYKRIIELLLNKRKDGSYAFGVLIIKKFAGIEDAANREILVRIGNESRHAVEILQDFLALKALYYNDPGNLTHIYYVYYNREIIKTIGENYDIGRFIGEHDAGEDIFCALCLLQCAMESAGTRRASKSIIPGMSDAINRALTTIENFLLMLIGETIKIKAYDLPAADLLLDELTHLKNLGLSVYIDYLLYRNAIDFNENIYTILLDPQRTLIFIEFLKDALSYTTANALIAVITENISLMDDALIFSNIKGLTADNIIYEIYRYIGEERMNLQHIDDIEKLIVFKSIPMFNELDINRLYQIIGISRYCTKSAGDILIRKGEASETFYVVISGSVGVYNDDEFICTLGKGEIFGEMGVIEKSTRTATIKVEEQSVFLEINGDDFINLILNNGTIALSVMKTISLRLRKMLERKNH